MKTAINVLVRIVSVILLIMIVLPLLINWAFGGATLFGDSPSLLQRLGSMLSFLAALLCLVVMVNIVMFKKGFMKSKTNLYFFTVIIFISVLSQGLFAIHFGFVFGSMLEINYNSFKYLLEYILVPYTIVTYSLAGISLITIYLIDKWSFKNTSAV